METSITTSLVFTPSPLVCTTELTLSKLLDGEAAMGLTTGLPKTHGEPHGVSQASSELPSVKCSSTKPCTHAPQISPDDLPEYTKSQSSFIVF
jgi:hypothetical protein